MNIEKFWRLTFLLFIATACVNVQVPTLVPAPTQYIVSPEPTIPVWTPTRNPSPTHTVSLMATRALTQTEQYELSQKLISAAPEGNTTRVRELISRGAPLNAQDAQGRTAVMAATYGNHVETVRVLLEAGADVNVLDTMRNNPFLYAGASGYLEILKLAYAAGADPKITNRFGGTALIPACERGHIEVVRYLLNETSVDVNHINNLGWTCLLEAVILSDGGARHQEIVKLVIEHGADVNIADKEGITPLQHATRRGYGEIATMLEAAGGK